MLTLISIPSDFITSTLSIVSQLYSDFSTIITLIVGALLITTILVIFIAGLRHK